MAVQQCVLGFSFRRLDLWFLPAIPKYMTVRAEILSVALNSKWKESSEWVFFHQVPTELCSPAAIINSGLIIAFRQHHGRQAEQEKEGL